MAGRGRPGPAPQTAKREQYAALIARGVVATRRRAGSSGSTAVPGSVGDTAGQSPAAAVGGCTMRPWSVAAAGGRSRHGFCRRTSGCESRTCAAPGWAFGRSPASWAAARRRSAGNCAATSMRTSGAYRPHAAQRLAEQRRARPKTGKLVADVELREFVQDKLKRRWSPGTDRRGSAIRVPWPAAPPRRAGDHLPGGLPPGPRWPVPGTAEGAAYRSAAPQAAPPRPMSAAAGWST